MTELAPVLTNCHVCRHPQVELINRRMREGVPVLGIVRWMKDEGMEPFHRNTLMKHRAQHLTSEFERQRQSAVVALEKQAQTLKPTATKDLASLVRDAAVARMEAGEIKPTISEGLRAQGLIDARMNKAVNLQVQVMIAQAMTRALRPAVEAEYKELAPSSD